MAIHPGTGREATGDEATTDVLIGRLRRAVETIEGQAKMIEKLSREAHNELRGIRDTAAECKLKMAGAAESFVKAAEDAAAGAQMIGDTRAAIDASCEKLGATFDAAEARTAKRWAQVDERLAAMLSAFDGVSDGAKAVRNLPGVIAEIGDAVRSAATLAEPLPGALARTGEHAARILTALDRATTTPANGTPDQIPAPSTPGESFRRRGGGDA